MYAMEVSASSLEGSKVMLHLQDHNKDCRKCSPEKPLRDERLTDGGTKIQASLYSDTFQLPNP